MNIRTQVEYLFNARREQKKDQIELKRIELKNKYPDYKQAEDDIKKYFENSAFNGSYDTNIMNELVEELETIKKKYKIEEQLREEYDCKLCNDTGYVDGKLCRCLKRELIDAYFKLGDNSGIIVDNRFENFNENLFSNNGANSPRDAIIKIKSLANKFVQDFENNKGESLFFYGKSGTGKTFMSGAIANAIKDKGYSVLYLTAIELVEFFRDRQFYSEDKKDYMDEKADLIKNCDLLVIDDLGVEQSNNLNSGYLYDVINYRVSFNKPFIINSNLGMSELSKRYADRIFSRIVGVSTNVEFIGGNIRLAAKK